MAPENDEPAAEELFRRLYERYYRFVVYLFRQRGFSLDDARDLAQDTFLRALTHLGGLRSEAAARSWLLQIATGVWSNEMRRIQTVKRGAKILSFDATREQEDGTVKPVMEIEDPEPSNPLDELASEERNQVVREALRRLPPQMRRCLLLHTFQGLKYKEVAVVMQISIETVKSHIHQARERLRGRLERHPARDLLG